MNLRRKEHIFNQKIEPEYTRVYHFIYSRLDGDRQLAEDITQDTMEMDWNKLEQLKKGDSCRAWLMKIAMNEIRKYFRAQMTQKRGAFQEESYDLHQFEEIDNPEQVEADVLDQILAQEGLEILMQALDRVHEKYRLLLELRLIQDLKFAQIAEIVREDEAKVRVYYGRGLKILGKEYQLLTGRDE